jgi:hypothetical protein
VGRITSDRDAVVAPSAVTFAPPSFCYLRSSHATGTNSSRRSRSGLTARGGRAPAPSTRCSASSTVTQQRDALGQPWDSAAAEVGEGRFDLMRTTRQLFVAARQVMEGGTDAQVKKATDIMKESRRRLYAVLSEEDPDS